MRLPFLVALAAPFALTACGDPAPTYVDQAWVRLSPNADRPSAGYFIAHGGDAGTQLRGVRTDYAQKVEMHETVEENGVIRMIPVDSVDIPAKSTVEFAPGGKHLMFWGINETAIRRGKMQLTFLMANGDRLLVDAVIRRPPAAASVPAGEAHNAH